MPEQLSQHTIEYFFKQYGVESPDHKAKLLPILTDVIYEYNMSVVKYEKETDEYVKNQILEEIKEIEAKIKSSIEEVVGQKS